MAEVMIFLIKTKIIKHYNEDLILKPPKTKSFNFFKVSKIKTKRKYIYILLKYQILLTFFGPTFQKLNFYVFSLVLHGITNNQT